MEQGAPSQRLKPGTKLGRYTIVEPLGAGGHGLSRTWMMLLAISSLFRGTSRGSTGRISV